MKRLPIFFNRKEECCGCAACAEFCAKAAISMVQDEEGFEYPIVDENRCICCHGCLMVCPIKAEKLNIIL